MFFKQKKALLLSLLFFPVLLFIAGCGESADSDVPPSVNIQDFWVGTAESTVSSAYVNITLSLSQANDEITGTYHCRDGNIICVHTEGTVEGTLQGNVLSLTVSFPDEHGCEMNNGFVSGLIISGEISCSDPAIDHSEIWEIHTFDSCAGALVSGLCLTLDSITPVYYRMPTNDVDAFLTDCDGDGYPDEPYWEPHNAKIRFSSSVFPGFDPLHVPEVSYIGTYEISYFPSPSNIGVSPDLTGMDLEIVILGLGAVDSFDPEYTLVSPSTKSQYAANGGSLFPPQSYTAVYSFFGKTDFNKQFTLQGSTSFNIGEFNRCP